MNRIVTIAAATVLVAGLAMPAAAQNVTASDIQRLRDTVDEAVPDVVAVRGRDARLADELQSELTDLRDEVIYLKVKLRKERSLARVEYTDVRDRIDNLRARAQRLAPPSPPPPPPPPVAPSLPPSSSAVPSRPSNEVPAGTELDVRLTGSLSSGTAKVEDRFEGTTVADLTIGGRVMIPAGAVMRGVVSAVEPASRTNRTAKMTVSFDQVTFNSRSYPLRATVTEAIKGEGVKGETGRLATGAGAGAIIGGLLGGFKGALAGILVGGGTMAATEGKQVEVEQGTVLRVRIDSPLTLGR